MRGTISPERIELFRRCFVGRRDVYGTYDVRTGRVRQVKASVTDDVIRKHLQGSQPYGVYLLVGERTMAVVADFDTEDLRAAVELAEAAKPYHIPAYIESSKSKGYHVWIFFAEPAPAAKARAVMRRLLFEIERPRTEVFPKHNALNANVAFGNFIHAPLFGRSVARGRTVFLDPADPNRPHPNQWNLLAGINRVSGATLDEVVQLNDLTDHTGYASRSVPPTVPSGATRGLPPCAQTMLADGVTEHQRVACFRLAVNLKKTGLPFDSALAVLTDWAKRNRPRDGKRVITKHEIVSQAACAFDKAYRACGCEDAAVSPYCDTGCPVRTTKQLNSNRVQTMSDKPEQMANDVSRSSGQPAMIASDVVQQAQRRSRLDHRASTATAECLICGATVTATSGRVQCPACGYVQCPSCPG